MFEVDLLLQVSLWFVVRVYALFISPLPNIHLFLQYLAEVVVSPPFVFLTTVKSELRPEIQVAAQNCWVKKGGAFTGEVRYIPSYHLPFIFGLRLAIYICVLFTVCP